jgi:GAF domain-containing protein
MPSQADREQGIIIAIYRAACDPAELNRVTALIAQHFNGSGAFLCEVDCTAPQGRLSVGAGTLDDAFMRDYQMFAHLDPAPEKFAAVPIGRATTSDRMFSPEFLRKSPFLHEFLRPRGIDGTLAAPLFVEAGRFAMVGVHQAAGGNQFQDSDIASLERLTSHLTRALQIRRLSQQHDLRSHAMEAVLNRRLAGIICLGVNGRPIFVNEAVQTLVAARDGLYLDRDGNLGIADQQGARQLLACQANVRRGGAGDVIRVRRPSGEPPYVILVSPLVSQDLLLGDRRRGILIAIHDPSRRVVTKVELVARLLNLPPGAAKVVAALLDGIDLKDYAEQAAISPNTVKFHLKKAFDLTGSRSQTDLVRRVLLALADLDP